MNCYSTVGGIMEEESLETHYMALLPNDEQDFIKNYLQTLYVDGNSAQSYNKRVAHLLVQRPNPTLQILLLQWRRFKFYIKQVLILALHQFLLQASSKGQVSTKFLNFLGNFPLELLSEEPSANLHNKLIKVLINAHEKSQIYLALLSRTETALLEDVVDQLKEQKWRNCNQQLPSKEYILYQAMERKMHFVPLISSQLRDFAKIADAGLRNTLLILTLVQEFSNYNQMLSELPNISHYMETFEVDKAPEQFQEIHQMFYIAFKRLSLMLDFIRKYSDSYRKMTIGDLMGASSVLELLKKFHINACYEDTRSLIDSVYALQTQLPSMNSSRDEEREILTYYAGLSCTYDIIIADINLGSEQYYATKIQELNSLMRQLRNIEVLCSFIEDIFRLVLLRWEHLCGDTDTHNQRSKMVCMSASSDTDDDAAAETPTPSTVNTASRVQTGLARTSAGHRSGFICRSRAFFAIFSFLKTFVTKKIHSADYKESTENNQKRFQNAIDVIGEALWKYSVLEKIDEAKKCAGTHQHFDLGPEQLLHLVYMHADSVDKGSSDEECQDRCNYTSLMRRKVAKKKRRRATFSGTVSTQSDDLTLQECRARVNAMAHSVSVSGPFGKFKETHYKTSSSTERSIIPRMLGSPERIAILALSLKNYNEVKQIIQTFNLQNTDLNCELAYVEQQEQVKQKLWTINANYQEQETNSQKSQEPIATVEQIRNVAAKGFEVSKIISVIDNFAQAQRIKQPAAVRELLEKHSNNPQYPFLRNFEERNLNAVIISDLILNLPFNREITTNILMVIKRQQQIASGIVTPYKDDSVVKAQIPKDIGPMMLLQNLCDCMRLLEDQSLRDLLCDNTYSLRPSKLAAELEREKIFHDIFKKSSKEVARCEDLKPLAMSFQNLKSKYNYFGRFSTYMANLTKLVQLRDPNCEYHIEELLKMNPHDIIGELIFDCNMTPLEIESYVSALNLNLVHVIALNICPEIVGKCGGEKRSVVAQKQETIINYISNQNHLLAFLLQCVINSNRFLSDATINSEFLQRLLELPEIEKLEKLYGGNKVITALRADNLDMKLVEQLPSKMDQLEILGLQMGIYESNQVLSQRIDRLIVELIAEDSKNIHLAADIHDVALRAKLIQKNFTKITTTRLAKELIEKTLQHRDAVMRVPRELLEQLESTLADITIYAKVSEVMQFDTWPQAYDFGLKTPNAIFERLLQLNLYKLCYEWCKVVGLADNFVAQRRAFLTVLLDAFLELGDEQTNQQSDFNRFDYLLQIFETFPPSECVRFLDEHKDKLRSMFLLQYAIDFLEKNAQNGTENYKNYRISLLIFKQLPPRVRDQLWGLLKFPLLIIEQLIMNAKFEILTKVLQAVRDSLDRENANMREAKKLCAFCFEKSGNIYDIHTRSQMPHKLRFQLGADAANATNSAFILLNFNLYQKDHVITDECIDLLLRIYATKALDYQISDTSSSSEPYSQSITDMQQSLDSLCGTFEMPREAPARTDWMRDEDATHCMCCRRAAFTMLMRRHHCRRCGRVVCFACSTHRIRIPELYEAVEVRICNDCYRCTEEHKQRELTQDDALAEMADFAEKGLTVHLSSAERFKWKLSGNITHDKLLREEFCYEHAPSVALCLSILEYHLDKQKCVDLLLYHCRKLEKLIVPNPEVDYELVAKMMSCLALAAKVRGGPPEVETIRQHSEIIISVVQNGCESLIPPDPLNNHGLRKLADSLVQAERWELALDVHLKCGFPTAGVMAAHGLSCLRAGCFDTARDKFCHCMPKLSNETTNALICKSILSPNTAIADNNDNPSGSAKDNTIPLVRRPQNGPPLLQEILKLIESLPLFKPQPETLKRASIIRNSNTSLASLLSRRKEPYVARMQEPALNILTTLANLKCISKGQYGMGANVVDTSVSRRQLFRQTRGFEECLYYVLTYGSHTDILQFLMYHKELLATLKYFLIQQLDAELFIQHIYLVGLRSGQVPQLISQLMEFDSRLVVWRSVLLQTCRFLETQNLYNSLYQLQILLNDPIRASMTCVKFYTMNCENFQQQHANAQHLRNAHLHLQSELELTKWENINMEPMRKRKDSSSSSSRRTSLTSCSTSDGIGSFFMQMDARSLNGHINTILRQLDVAKFLAKCELENSPADGLITHKVLQQIRSEASDVLPTLFDKTRDIIQICTLILLCGKNIDEGFGLAYRIIQDYKLPAMKIFTATAKYLACNQRLPEVDKLLNCITGNNGTSHRDIDEILSVAISSAANSHEPEVRSALDNLTKKIHSVELRISCHICIGQLKSAYLLANKYERISDIRRILRQAELTNQIHIKKLCEKKLQMSALHAPPPPPQL